VHEGCLYSFVWFREILLSSGEPPVKHEPQKSKYNETFFLHMVFVLIMFLKVFDVKVLTLQIEDNNFASNSILKIRIVYSTLS